MISPELSVLLDALEVQSVALDRPEAKRAVEEIKSRTRILRLANEVVWALYAAGLASATERIASTVKYYDQACAAHQERFGLE